MTAPTTTCPIAWCHSHCAEGPNNSDVYHWGAEVYIESADARRGSVRACVYVDPKRIDRLVEIDGDEFTPAGAREYAAAILRAAEQVEQADVAMTSL